MLTTAIWSRFTTDDYSLQLFSHASTDRDWIYFCA